MANFINDLKKRPTQTLNEMHFRSSGYEKELIEKELIYRMYS